jgi:hypothetical protein
MHMLRGLGLLAAVGLAGCGSSVDVTPDSAPPDLQSRLGDKTNINLADWLKKPREELADLVAQWSDTIQKQRLHAQENPHSLDLLPGLEPPGTMPVFAQAAYSPKAGFSLPPYLNAGDKDAAVALHLARLGDQEASLKIADPTDKDLQNRIGRRWAERNYPLEWTQLTALAFQSAQWNLATGEAQAATDIVQMHKQLRKLLDDKAAAGPLGAALLPLGRRAIVEAAAAWKKPNVNRPRLAEDAAAALKAWGETPPPALALAPGASQFDAIRLFGGPAAPQAVAAADPQTVRRVLDLLELPVPSEGVQAVAALFDADKRLTETLVLYRAHIIQTLPEPNNLAHYLVDHALPADDVAKGVGLSRRVFTGDGLKYEAVVFNRGDGLGAVMRITGAKATSPLPPEARAFGAVHLNGTFEQNRLQFARDQTGATVELNCRQSPGVVRLPVADPIPDLAVLAQVNEVNLTASLTASWPAEEMPIALTKIVAPLLGAYGSPHIDGVEDANGECVAFVWEDARTRLTLRLPYGPSSPVFQAENRPGAESADGRVAAAEAFDQAQRKTRLEAGKPLKWLPRTVGIPEIRLGMTRKQVQDNLPLKPSIDYLNFGGDQSQVYRDVPARETTYFIRQTFLRFAPDGRLTEIRVRYKEGPAKPDDSHPSLLGALKQLHGEPRVLPAPWVSLWPELPAQQPKPTLYRWADDVTVLTCQRDGGGAEVIVRDWAPGLTVDQVNETLPPMRFCAEGPGAVFLGQTRADVMMKIANPKPLDNEDGVAYAPAADSPYETIAVWFDSGKVARIVAQHRVQPTDAADATAKIQEAWGRDFDHLGAPRRQEGASGSVQQGFGWHDDKVRVRMLVQQTVEGPRIFTEWRNWPVTAKP